MIKRIQFFLLLIIFHTSVDAQIPIKIGEKTIDSLQYKSKTTWITLTPFFFVNRKFSPDHGETWKNIGMFGQNLKPYLISDSIATQNINIYKYTRAAGILQMWVLTPLLAYRHFTYDPSEKFSTGDDIIDQSTYQEEESGYLTAAVLVFITGSFTYHVLSKTYLFRSLHDYNRGILDNSFLESAEINLNLIVDPVSNSPQLGIVITF
ncbi:MAG: hypothetical protein A2W99_11935 [Bacteroidetes bacterium GWF2_33_16]|nr:MAG: hypothetical protein A2X00_02340 [Bacteroidetes bacterium GWE2_32_14]OFY06409.1 MAG: hypothetical protein A2W99_11935 [Bacteroidetes bacterium GWF2_33_16]